jgi:hypothetical protein
VIEPEVEKLLDELEHAAEKLRDFRATVAYEKFDALTGGAELQYGRLLYLKDGSAVRLAGAL